MSFPPRPLYPPAHSARLTERDRQVAKAIAFYQACRRRAGRLSLRPAAASQEKFYAALDGLRDALAGAQQAESAYHWAGAELDGERRPRLLSALDAARAAGLPIPADLAAAPDPKLLVGIRHAIADIAQPLPPAVAALAAEREASRAAWLARIDLTDAFEAAGPDLVLAREDADETLSAFGQDLTAISPAVYRKVMGFTLVNGVVETALWIWGVLLLGLGKALGAWRRQDRYTGVRRVAMVAGPMAAVALSVAAGWEAWQWVFPTVQNGASFLQP